MRYILDDSGYIDSVSCTPFNCKDKSCTEYTGAIPSGYETLAEWAQNANIRAYKLVGGNLTFDAAKDAELQAEWEECCYKTNILTARLTANYAIKTANTYETLPLTLWDKTGNKLSVNNSGAIVIGAGVKKIKVCANTRVGSGTVGNKYLTIQNSNGQQLVQAIQGKASTSYAIDISISAAIFSVTEGETLSLKVYGAAGDTYNGASQEYGMLTTYLTAEVIE